MHPVIKRLMAVMVGVVLTLNLAGCSIGDGRRIVRISHNQSEIHPTHLGLLAFEKHVEEKLGDRYDVQIFPNELLGSQNKTIELCQTGAIDFTVASVSILESFDKVYSIFNLPYLFDSEEHYHAVMEDPSIMDPIYESTENSGFATVAWLDAGTRNFYTVKKPINTPDDLKGLKIRVQQSATNIRMMVLFGGAATPMGFGEVYTVLQQSVIDGAENNELALINNKHGEVAKYYTYNMHQMVPDLIVGNVKFLNNLPADERQVFDEAAALCNQVQRENWTKTIQAAREEAQNEMGVQFIYPDVQLFQAKVMPLHQELLAANPKLQPIYDAIRVAGDTMKKEG